MLRIFKLFFYHLKRANFSIIFNLIKNRRFNHRDIYIKLKKYLFQKRIKNKINSFGNNYFFEEKYFLKKSKYNNFDKFIDEFDFRDFTFFEKTINNLKASNNNSEVIKQADLVLCHIFDLLGSNNVELKYGMEVNGIEGIKYLSKSKPEPNVFLLDDKYVPIDWHIDFKSGYRWDKNSFYNQIQSSGNKKGVDIKLPWELSRCQHFGILGNAFIITNDEKYANEIKNQIIDWINNNPYCCGVNWVCAMDVAIRISNWLLAIEMIKDSSAINDRNFLKIFFKSINHHQEYLLNNLEWRSTLTSNHYLSDIVGLLFIASYFPHFKNSEKINKTYITKIEKEIFKQTYSDGMNSEGSTSYHRLVLELFAFSAIIAKNAKNKFSLNFLARLKKMFNFTKYITKNDGKIPQIGDNDSGLFIKFFNRDLLDHSYLDDIYKEIFNANINDLYSNGEERVVEDSGIFLYKDKNLYFLIYNGENGQKGNGGHAHNDKLSFILEYKKKDIFIDPGTYLYTPIPEKRNLFRSTKSHNTVCVDNKEQNRFIDGYLFGMNHDCDNLISEFNLNDNGFYFNGQHNGYQRIDKKLIHQRTIKFSKSENIIYIDDFFEDTDLKKSLSLIVNKNIFKEISKNKLIFENGYAEFKKNISIRKSPFFISRGYGHSDCDALRVEVDFYQKLETKIYLNEE